MGVPQSSLADTADSKPTVERTWRGIALDNPRPPDLDSFQKSLALLKTHLYAQF
jgi:hypothetical protein